MAAATDSHVAGRGEDYPELCTKGATCPALERMKKATDKKMEDQHVMCSLEQRETIRQVLKEELNSTGNWIRSGLGGGAGGGLLYLVAELFRMAGGG